MSWTWVRPADPTVLEGRPLLDLGTGDGQTLGALAPNGLVVGIDKDARLLRRGDVQADARCLPTASGTFEAVLAADLFHHLDEQALSEVLVEIVRVLTPTGRLVAWWYEKLGQPAPDAPLFPRTCEPVAAAVRDAGFETVAPLALSATTVSGPPTVGVVASR